MIGEQAAFAVQRLHQHEERRQARRHVEVGALVAQLPVDLRQRRGPKPPPAVGKIEVHQHRVAAIELEQRCQAGARIGDRRERRDDQRHRRGHRLVGLPVAPGRAHRQRILADGNRQSQRDAEVDRDRAHGVVERRVLARLSRRRHPVGRQLDLTQVADARSREIGNRLGDRHAPRSRGVDQRDRRALADGHRFARVAREIRERDRDVGDRHLPGTDHRIARAESADGAIADRDQKGLVGDRRQLQHAIGRLADVDAVELQRRQPSRKALDITLHLRRLAEDHVERNVDRRVAEMRVVDDQAPLGIRTADDGVGAAFAGADRIEARKVPGGDRQNVALLRLVAPDLARGHARLLGGHRAQVAAAADTTAVHQLGKRIREPAGAHVVDRHDRIGLAQLPAAIDHLLRAALHFGVAALHRIEIEVGGIGAGRHRRRSAAAHADQHAGPAELDQQHALGQCALLHVDVGDVAHAARDHDRLVIAAPLPVDLELEGPEIAGEIGTPEFVVVRRRADRALGHDRKRRRDALRLADPAPLPSPPGRGVGGEGRDLPSPSGRGVGGEGQLPWLRQLGNPQVRHRVPDEPRLRLRTPARRTLVADLAARTRRRAGKRRDRGRMVVRLDLHQDLREPAMRRIAAVCARMEALDDRAFDDRCIVLVCDERALRMRRMRRADHREQALRLLDTVDAPGGIEDLVPAMLGVRLREHHQLDVGGVAPEASERPRQVLDLVGGQREAELAIRLVQSGTTARSECHGRHRTRRDVREQAPGSLGTVEDCLGHPVVDQRQQRGAVRGSQRRSSDGPHVVRDPALDARDGVETAVPGDVGRLGRPRRNRSGSRHDEQAAVARIAVVIGRSVGQQAIERGTLVVTQRAEDLDEMPVARRQRRNPVLRMSGVEGGPKLGDAER